MSDLFPGDFAAAETGIFWDIEDCKIPDDLNAGDALKNIKSALSSDGHHGTVSVRAYGDTTGLDFPSEGIKLNHFPAGERYARQTKMLEDIVSWSAEHPEPSTLFLIVGDTSRDFLDVVQLLKSKKNYNFIIYNFILYVYYQKTEHSYLAPIPSILLI
ncbi:putative NYN domain, limkain-b1-type, meiosis regulator and mRNA stability factor 1 [Arabidopsis thaliana]|uniref:NYN domain-containing protein n=2 Tax=Arabidopsis thaliana TaxID=3702 RepID=A0A5S9XNP0_ARATH|nr:unknown [Arabidopsis thaliana]CAA0387994.1 unnamed protein product [Arabidopsis thaliana]